MQNIDNLLVYKNLRTIPKTNIFMVKKLFILTIALLALMSCCNQDDVYQNLDMSRQPYTGKELRTDGYYYSGYVHRNKIGTLMLFRNGVCMFTYFGNRYDELNLYIENHIWGSSAYVDKMRNTPDNIGVFSVSGHVLEFQVFWQGGGTATRSCMGEILNDTTLRLKRWRYNLDGTVEDIDELYYFKPFSHKPDSTSSFIK